MRHSLTASNDNKERNAFGIIRRWRLFIIFLAISFLLGVLYWLETTAFGLVVVPMRRLSLPAKHFSLNAAYLPTSSLIIEEKISKPERRNNGLTTAVEWDDISLFILGRRFFIW